MITIEIRSKEVIETTIRPSKKEGSRQFDPFQKYTQVGYAFIIAGDGVAEPHPTKIEVPAEKDRPGYEPGLYTILPQSLYVDRFGGLAIGRMKLAKLPAATLKAA